MSLHELSSKERSTLRAAAHSLKPIVQIGENNGLTAAVLKEIDHSLTAHGLIKVRVAGDERENRLEILEKICTELACVCVAHFGKILTLFRPEPHHGHFLAASKPALERSRRDPKEDYTPKKLAAAGKSIKDKKQKSSAPKGNDELAKPRKKPAIPVRKASGQMARPSTRTSARPVARRTGSALTLRAGRRK